MRRAKRKAARESDAAIRRVAGKRRGSRPKQSKARRVALSLRVDGEDALVFSFDRKALGGVFGPTKRRAGGADLADFAAGLRMAVQAAAPALANMPIPRQVADAPTEITEVGHAENVARSHEVMRMVGFKHCPHCGTDLKPS